MDKEGKVGGGEKEFPWKKSVCKLQLSDNTFGIYLYQESWVLNYGSDFNDVHKHPLSISW